MNIIINLIKVEIFMEKVIEKSLIVRKENPFEKIVKSIYGVFFREEYMLEKRLDDFVSCRKVDVSKIVIPREINNFK